MSTIRIDEANQGTINRINKILAGVPGGAYKAAYNALKRAGDTAKTKAGQFAAAEYAITKSTFMSNVKEKTRITGGNSMGGVASLSISFAGTVLPLLSFSTKYSRDGALTTQVMRNGGAATLQHAFAARVFGPIAVFERVGAPRFPVEQKFGPSTGHMMQNEKVVEQMDKTIQETFEQRAEHEILRLLNGWGG
jgi:hypothetical protein